MKALRWDGALSVEEVSPPEPAEGEALVRVTLAGVCATDVAITRGYAGFRGTLGHEFVGVVERAGEGSWVGRRVVGEINVGCGRCGCCARGEQAHCDAREALGIRGRDGCFAEYITLPVRNLHAVPDGLEDARAVFTEPVAAAFQVLDRCPLRGSERVAVLGDGKLGLLVAQTLVGVGCDVTVGGRHPRKLALAEARGARAARSEELPGGFDVVVECTGSPEGLSLALARVRPRGVVVLKSTFPGPTSVELSRAVVDEVSVVGSRCGPFGPALRALASGRVDPSGLVDAVFPLRESLAAFAWATRRGALKVLLDPRG